MITRRRRTSRGFTLLELMASMAISVIVLMLAVSVLSRTGDSYEEIGGGIGAQREARAALNQISADLSTAIYHDDEVFIQQGSGWTVDKIGFLSLQPSDAQASDQNIGDICTVNYYVADIIVGGKTVRCLKRGFRNSLETFGAIRNDSLAPLFAPNENLDEEIAYGVVSFEARPKIRDENGTLKEWDKTMNEQPQFLDVRLVIARPDLAGKLNTPSDWSGGGKASRVLGTPAEATHSRGLEVYQTTIRFGNDSSER